MTKRLWSVFSYWLLQNLSFFLFKSDFWIPPLSCSKRKCLEVARYCSESNVFPWRVPRLPSWFPGVRNWLFTFFFPSHTSRGLLWVWGSPYLFLKSSIAVLSTSSSKGSHISSQYPAYFTRTSLPLPLFLAFYWTHSISSTKCSLCKLINTGPGWLSSHSWLGSRSPLTGLRRSV
jgi:hypothetical protein